MRRIRAMSAPERRDLPAIALTAFARQEDAAKARQAGYGVHLPKPVDPSRLFSTIASVLTASSTMTADVADRTPLRAVRSSGASRR